MRPVKILTMILAGGIGERLYPLTANRSKPAVPFGGNFRIIDFTLMNCVLSGMRKIHVLTQYHTASLARHKSERWNFLSSELGEYVEIVPPKMRSSTSLYSGTADAIYRNLDILDQHRPDVVLILSGDHIYRADYQRFVEAHMASDADVTVLTDWIDTPSASSFGVVQGSEGRIESFVEKPADPTPYEHDGRCQINLGVYCFGTRFLVERLISDSRKRTAHDFDKNILPTSLTRGSVMSCPLEVICPDSKPYWRDVGTIDAYYESNMDTLASTGGFDLHDTRWPEASRFHEWLPTRFPGARPASSSSRPGRNLVSSACEVGSAHVDRSVLSPGVEIGDGAVIDGSILFPGVRVGRDVRLERVIVEEGVTIPDGIEIRAESDSGLCTRTPGGVTVVSASQRFDAPGPITVRSVPTASGRLTAAPAANVKSKNRIAKSARQRASSNAG